MHVMRIGPMGSNESLETILARLRADPAVEYAEPDERRYPTAIPNDPASGAIKPFPKSSDSTVADCHVPTGPGDIQASECNCTTDTCGAGMANADRSVAEALRPFAAATASPTAPASGQTVNLNDSDSLASNGRTITAYAWTVASAAGSTPALVNADTQNASFTAGDNGLVTLQLTVTDNQGAQDSANVQVNASGSGGAVTVTVAPDSASVAAGGGTQAFTATVTNATNTAVTRQVNGVTGGNSTVGTVSNTGLYTAPATVPSPSTVTVIATSVADTSASGSAQVTVVSAAPAQQPRNGGGGAFDVGWLLIVLLGLVPQRQLSIVGSPPPPSSLG